MTQVNSRENREQLKELLIKHSLMFGDFTLVSGKKSRYYFDSKKTTLLPEGAWRVARVILDLLQEEEIQADAIGGMTLGADPIVCPVAALSHETDRPLPAFIVRKEAKGHGTSRQIEGELKPASSVVIVDDVVTTAGSTLRAIAAVEEGGPPGGRRHCPGRSRGRWDRGTGRLPVLSDLPTLRNFRGAGLGPKRNLTRASQKAEIMSDDSTRNRPARHGSRAGGIMHVSTKRMTSLGLMIAMTLFALPVTAASPVKSGAIEGLVINVDGRVADGFRIHLIDKNGSAVAVADVNDLGRYAFADVSAGEYALGIESNDGRFAPVSAPTLKVATRELVRRDLKLTGADADRRNEALGANYSLGSWWAGLAPAAKVWSVLAVVAAAALTVAALDDDDETITSDPMPVPLK